MEGDKSIRPVDYTPPEGPNPAAATLRGSHARLSALERRKPGVPIDVQFEKNAKAVAHFIDWYPKDMKPIERLRLRSEELEQIQYAKYVKAKQTYDQLMQGYLRKRQQFGGRISLQEMESIVLAKRHLLMRGNKFRRYYKRWMDSRYPGWLIPGEF